MMKPAAPVPALVIVVLLTAVGSVAQSGAQSATDSPEPIILALAKAIYANDTAGYERITIPDPRRSRLTAGGKANPAKLKELTEDPDSLQLRRRRPFLFRGSQAAPDASGAYPVGTTALYLVAHGGSPIVVTLVRQTDGWKVDLRWWLAMLELQTAAPKAGTPEFAARALMAALVNMDRREAAKYATPRASMDILFLGAQREPSGQLNALAMEMPVVELQPGEFYPMRDRVVEGSSQPDLKILLGLFGAIEVPFVVRKIGSDWRVEPQPYFALINR